MVNNFIPTELLILKVFRRTGQINFSNVLLNNLHEVELRMPGSNLFYSLVALGTETFLKYLDLQETVLNQLAC